MIPINAESYYTRSSAEAGRRRPPCVFWDTGICKNDDSAWLLLSHKQVAYEVWTRCARSGRHRSPAISRAANARDPRGDAGAGLEERLTDLVVKRGGKPVPAAIRTISAARGISRSTTRCGPNHHRHARDDRKARTISCVIRPRCSSSSADRAIRRSGSLTRAGAIRSSRGSACHPPPGRSGARHRLQYAACSARPSSTQSRMSWMPHARHACVESRRTDSRVSATRSQRAAAGTLRRSERLDWQRSGSASQADPACRLSLSHLDPAEFRREVRRTNAGPEGPGPASGGRSSCRAVSRRAPPAPARQFAGPEDPLGVRRCSPRCPSGSRVNTSKIAGTSPSAAADVDGTPIASMCGRQCSTG